MVTNLLGLIYDVDFESFTVLMTASLYFTLILAFSGLDIANRSSATVTPIQDYIYELAACQCTYEYNGSGRGMLPNVVN